MIDPLGIETDYTYDALGRLIKVVSAAGTPAEATVTYTYDSVGNRTSVTDADGNRTTYQYDLMNNLVKTVDPLGGVTTSTYDPWATSRPRPTHSATRPVMFMTR